MAPDKSELKGEIIRRALHIFMGAIILVYLFPEIIAGVPIAAYLICFFVIIPIIIETIRLQKKSLFLGLREYEKDRVASYVWFTIGATILIIFFPQQIAAPCILATAIGDPVIGITRKLRRRLTFSITIIICVLVFWIFQYDILLAIFAGGVAFMAQFIEFRVQWRVRKSFFWSRSKQHVSEYRNYFDFLFKTDDDFMMQAIPAVILFILFLLAPDLMPDLLLEPIEQLAFLK